MVETKLCECGCGIKIPKYRCDGKTRKYLVGHARRGKKEPEYITKKRIISVKKAFRLKKKKLGYIISPDGIKNIIKSAKRVHTGKIVRPESMQRHWSTRREKYGENGLSKKGCKQFGWYNGNRPNAPENCNDIKRYAPLHYYLRRHIPESFVCYSCDTQGKTDICCLNGVYDYDLKNYVRMCRLCHARHDNIWEKAWNTKRTKK